MDLPESIEHSSYALLCSRPILEQRKSLLQDLPERQRNEAVQYAFELDSLHEDLERILFELSWADEDCPDLVDLGRFKWLLLYHTDNFYLRVYSYAERIYKFLNIVLRLGVIEKPAKSYDRSGRETGFRGAIISALEERGYSRLHQQLKELAADPMFKSAMGRRHALTHRLPIREWPSLETVRRFLNEVEFELDPDSRIIKEVEEFPNLKAFSEQKGNELSGILRLLNELRIGICRELVKIGV